MRIAISGAQSVGKTTLINALKSEPMFKDFKFCTETTRRVRSYGLPINQEGTNITQRLIMQEHIVNVFMHDNMIADRCAIDGLVYTKYMYRAGTHRHVSERVTEKTYLFAQKVMEKLLPHYDLIFFIQPEFEIENDGVRSIDKNFQYEINNAFVQLFDRLREDHPHLPVHNLSGPVRQRVNDFISVVSGITDAPLSSME